MPLRSQAPFLCVAAVARIRGKDLLPELSDAFLPKERSRCLRDMPFTAPLDSGVARVSVRRLRVSQWEARGLCVVGVVSRGAVAVSLILCAMRPASLTSNLQPMRAVSRFVPIPFLPFVPPFCLHKYGNDILTASQPTALGRGLWQDRPHERPVSPSPLAPQVTAPPCVFAETEQVRMGCRKHFGNGCSQNEWEWKSVKQIEGRA
jgi:hypothetical protein